MTEAVRVEIIRLPYSDWSSRYMVQRVPKRGIDVYTATLWGARRVANRMIKASQPPAILIETVRQNGRGFIYSEVKVDRP